MLRFDRFAESRHHELRARFLAKRQQFLGGLIPGMHGQAEGAPMHRQKRATAEQRQRFERVLRSEMNIAPSRMKGADFQHHQVERPKPVANQLVLAR